MKKCSLILLTALSVASLDTIIAEGRESGYRGTEQQQRACRPDALRHCRGVDDDRAIEACLRANVDRLRPACRHVIAGG
jgi:hypothetical protein